jgi:NAD(P)-dependent dehydrogenase (short-subunit alcohol dehydrogenase family)
MARVFITGSSDGLGRMAAQLLTEHGYRVVLHSRNGRRGQEAISAVPGTEAVVIGDLASITQTRSLAPSQSGWLISGWRTSTHCSANFCL